MSRLLRELARVTSAGSNWRNEPQKQSFDIRWSKFSKKEFEANMYGIRKINLVVKFFLSLLNDYGTGNQFTEVVHGKLGKDFLENELRLF